MGLPLPGAGDAGRVSGRDSTPRRHHPPPQRIVIHRDAVFARQVLGGQRRAKPHVHRPAVLLPDERQHPLAVGRRPRLIRRAPPRPGASGPWLLRRDTAAPGASPADSSRPASSPPIPDSACRPSRDSTPRPGSTLAHSSMSLPAMTPFQAISLGDISISRRRGHYQSRQHAGAAGRSEARMRRNCPEMCVSLSRVAPSGSSQEVMCAHRR
jgi:hypothetical protein